MITTNEHPLVTFALIAYNQEQYVRQAVTAAFAQTYQPLEIILSDDCSTDGTFAIMQEMVAGYCGAHRVAMNRNESNLGLANHVNRIMSLAKGEMIVVAAGDDVSRPDRVERVYQYMSTSEPCDSVCSAVEIIDGSGGSVRIERPNESSFSSVDLAIAAKGVDFKGASLCWTRRTFDVFGPIPDWVFCEDKTIGFRSLLLSRVGFIDEPLVRYRRHPDTLSGGRSPRWSYWEFLKHEARAYSRQAQYLRANLSDLAVAQRLGLLHPADGVRWARALEGLIAEAVTYVAFVSGPPASRRALWRSLESENPLLLQRRWLAWARWGDPLGMAGYYGSAIVGALRRILSASIRRTWVSGGSA